MSTEKMILGVSILGHDLSITVIDETGKVIFVAEEERYSRIKGGNFAFLPPLILSILSEYQVSPKKITTLVIAGRPEYWTKESLKWLTYNPVLRHKHYSIWLKLLKEKLPNLIRTFRIRHHLAHSASAFFPTDYRRSMIVTADAFGDNEVATISYGKDNHIKKIYSLQFPHSITYLYEAIALWLGLRGKEKAGKLMGLAAYGEPIYLDLIRKLYSTKEKKFQLSESLLKVKCKSFIWADALENILGRAREPNSQFTDYHYHIASSTQKIFEKEILKIIMKASEHNKSENLCCAGGAFMNSVLNGKIISKQIFKNVYFQPLAGDNGLSLGAALYAAQKLNYPKQRMNNLYLGSKLNTTKLPINTYNKNLKVKKYSCYKEAINHAVKLLMSGVAVGWCQGRMEAGARALGNRSILADPRKKQIVNILNKIKDRENWRPFASTVLFEDRNKFFDCLDSRPYMNTVHDVKLVNSIPASSHIDRTARIQTVNAKENKHLYYLLNEFKKQTGIGVLLNTSFNVRGVPIARTAEDCIESFLLSDLEVLFINNYLIKKISPLSMGLLQSKNSHYLSTLLEENLPNEFNLLVLNPSRDNFDIDELLKYSDTNKIILHGNDCWKCECYISILSDIEKNKPIVIYFPWFLEVFVQTLPTIMSCLNKLYELSDNRILIIDKNYKILDLGQLINAYRKELQYKENNSDVEYHFKKRNQHKRQFSRFMTVH